VKLVVFSYMYHIAQFFHFQTLEHCGQEAGITYSGIPGIDSWPRGLLTWQDFLGFTQTFQKMLR